MSSIIRLASVRCCRCLPLTRVRSYVGLKPSPRLSVGFRGYCFVPRSMNVPEQNKQITGSLNLKVPDDFVLIYKFVSPFFVQFTTAFAAFLSLGTGFMIYQYMTEENNTIGDEKPAPIADGENPLKEKKFSWKDVSEFDWNFENIVGPSEKLVAILLLPVCIFSLLQTRTGIVLTAYRRGNEYISFVTGRFGFGLKIMEYECRDVKYYPERKIYKHEIKGRKVLFFQENFVNESEKYMLQFGTNLKESGSKK